MNSNSRYDATYSFDHHAHARRRFRGPSDYGRHNARGRLTYGVLLIVRNLLHTAQALTSVEGFNGWNWRAMPSMKTPRMYHAAAEFKGKAYVMGGQKSYDGSDQSSVEVFDGRRWNVAASMPHPKDGLAAVVLDAKLYAIGGGAGAFIALRSSRLQFGFKAVLIIET